MAREKKSPQRKLLEALLIVGLLPLVLPLAFLVLTLAILHRVTLWFLIQILWLPRGKDVLLVYSDSTIWNAYMLQEILPLVEERAVVLNWSERRRWHSCSLAVMAFRSYGRNRNFNPLVLRFQRIGRTRVFRFWQAFQDQKRGYPEPLRRLKQELFIAL